MSTQASMDDSAETMSTSITDLPAPLLAQILRHLPQQQRFRTSVVSRAWSVAAAAATTELKHSLTPHNADGLCSWLRKHKQQLDSVELTGPVEQRPGEECETLSAHNFGRLQRLILQRVKVRFSCIAVPGIRDVVDLDTPLLPHLKHLELRHCQLHCERCFKQLASGTGLTSLVLLGRETFHSYLREYRGAFDAAVASVLQRQQQQQQPCLRLLHVDQPLTSTTIACVAGMQCLQDLRLVVDADSWGSCLAQLPTSLSSLQLEDSRDMERFHGSTLPPEGLQRLGHLHHLQLSSAFYDRYHVGGPRANAFSALTAAASHLTTLVLGHETEPLPGLRSSHCKAPDIFPARRRLPHLRKLSMQLLWGFCIDGKDVEHILSCCPCLEELDLTGVDYNDANVKALLRLPQSCSRLGVDGQAFGDASTSVLAQLTQVTSLEFQSTHTLTEWGLEQLAALPHLKALHVQSNDRMTHSYVLQESADKGSVQEQMQALLTEQRQRRRDENDSDYRFQFTCMMPDGWSE